MPESKSSYARSLVNKLYGAGEIGAMIGTAAIAEPFAGYAGLFNIGRGAEQGTEAIEAFRDKYTYQPRSETARGWLESAAPYVEKAGKWIDRKATDLETATGIPRELTKGAGQFTFEISPIIAGKAIKVAKKSKARTKHIEKEQKLRDEVLKRETPGTIFPQSREARKTVYEKEQKVYDEAEHGYADVREKFPKPLVSEVGITQPLPRNKMPVLREDLGPNDEWLLRKQRNVDKQVLKSVRKEDRDYRKERGKSVITHYTGDAEITGWFKGPVMIPVSKLKDLKGVVGEHRGFGEGGGASKLARVHKNVERAGWHPEAIMVRVNHHGRAYIHNGNHRVQEAVRLGIKEIPVQLQYTLGGQTVKGPWHVDKVKKMHYNPSPKKFVETKSGEGGAIPHVGKGGPLGRKKKSMQRIEERDKAIAEQRQRDFSLVKEDISKGSLPGVRRNELDPSTGAMIYNKNTREMISNDLNKPIWSKGNTLEKEYGKDFDGIQAFYKERLEYSKTSPGTKTSPHYTKHKRQEGKSAQRKIEFMNYVRGMIHEIYTTGVPNRELVMHKLLTRGKITPSEHPNAMKNWIDISLRKTKLRSKEYKLKEELTQTENIFPRNRIIKDLEKVEADLKKIETEVDEVTTDILTGEYLKKDIPYKRFIDEYLGI